MSESEKVDDADAEFYDAIVRKAEPGVQSATGIVGWSLYTDYGGTWLTSEQCAVQPQPGEKVRFYGKGMGYWIRGIVIEGRAYRYSPRGTPCPLTGAT